MTTNNFRLESGHEYSLKQLFNGKNRIVIPDLQRDYCWGDKAWNKDANNYTELVSGFIDSLLSVFNENPDDNLILGLIYGYENPHCTIQLCDGQQRITTLYLLLGMINRKTENVFQNLLISDTELDDDKDTNLQYAIRESTLYFLSDLVCEFFLKKEVKIEELKKEEWYFKEYDLDASIQSMLSAIKTIENKITNVNCEKFGDFIINNLQMLYYDMGHRTRGEETFVVINTTGEPLTATENLKPILIGNIKDELKKNIASIEWEDREEWFWKNRSSGEQTSDKALKEFFIWYWQIRLLQEKSWKDKKSYPLNPNELFQKKPIVLEEQEENPDIDKWEDSKNFDTIHKYFIALNLLIDKCKDDKIASVLKTMHNEDISLSWFRKVDLFEVTLPLIAYVVKFKDVDLYQFVRRIRKNYFDNKWTERKTNYLDWRHIIQIIEFSNTEDEALKFETKINIDKFKKISKITLNEWYNDEEKLKNNLILQQAEIEEWEDHLDFMGDLSFLFSTNKIRGLENSFDELRKYYINFINVVDLIRAKSSIPKSNTFRLFLLYIGCEKVEHKPRVSSEIEGVLFSTLRRNHLFNEDFKILCFQDANDLENYCLKFIKNKIEEWNLFDLTESNFTTDRALKCWLTLKVFNANNKNVCLTYFDGNNSEEGVSVYRVAKSNKLIDSESFSLFNMICGFGVKAGGSGSYVNYTNSGLWFKPIIIDAPFAGVVHISEERTLDQLDLNKKNIESILESIKN